MMWLGLSPDLYASIARVSISGPMPRIVGIPRSPPSGRWQDAHSAASWAPPSRSAAWLRSARMINDPAAIETAMIWRMRCWLRSICGRRTLCSWREAAWQHRYDTLGDCELMLQYVDAAAILFPNERETTALCRAQVEFDKRICRNGLVEVDAEHHNVVVAAGKLFDDLARNDVALVITTQAGLHLMAYQGLDQKHLTPRGGAWHLHTGCRNEHFAPPQGMSLASVGGNFDPGLGHQQLTVAHLRHGQDILRFGEADAHRYAGFAALCDKMK